MAPYLLRHSSMNCSLFRFLLPLLLLGWRGSAAEVSIPSQVATASQLIATTATLSTEGAQISGLQFDLEWDAGLNVQIVVGRGVVNSGKLLYSAQLAPRSLRVLIVGLDQGTLADGELLRLFIVAGSAVGSSQLRLTNLVGATPDGNPVAVRASAATIRVDPRTSGVTLLPESVLNAASLRSGPIAPGEIVTLLGAFGINPDSSSGVVATVNGVATIVLYAGGNQINTVVPVSLNPSVPAELTVRNQNRQIAQVTVPTAAASPALFTQNGTGIGPGAILNENYSPNSPSNPAPAGSVVMMYGTGFGPLIPPADDGQPGILAATAIPVSAKIAGIPADVLYAGAAPGLPAGVVQINIRIPIELTSRQAATIEIKVGSFEIPAGVSIAIR
ncbi:MAG: hypothetical protein JWO19_2358 [Bryobacterales bacterium]|nr:hypothetical protein [Bryobacterales bacterium]